MRITISLRSRVALLLVACIGLLAAFTTPAMAAYTVDVTDATPSQTDDAMAYSNFSLAMSFPQDSTPKSVTVDLPKGQLGALDNATKCTDANWQSDNCADSSRIGGISTDVTAVAVATLGIPINLTATGGMYRLNTVGTEVGRFGLTVASSLSETMYIEGTFRLRNDGSYAIRAEVPNIPKTAKVNFLGLGLGNANITINSMLMTMYGRVYNSTSGFFFNPPECVLATTNVSSTAWDNSVDTDSLGYTPTNCAAAPFNPTLAFGPAATAAATPTAFSVNVSQPFSPAAARVNAPFKNVTLTLPPGVQLSGATDSDGALVACTDAQFNVTQNTPSTCPAGAKIGTVAMDSPLIGVIPGDVFLAQPAAPVGANDLVRLFVVAQLGTATDAVRVKFPAAVSIDPTTGRLITTLTNLPAQPVKSFAFSFRAGTAPALRQPRTCATYVGDGSLVSYSSATAAARTGNYVVNSNCPPAGRFRPTIGMVQTPNRAGAAATGVTTIDLPVGDEAFTSVTASLPPGLLANIASVTRCTLTQAGAGSCPTASKVGTVQSLAGQSTVPGTFNGEIFLTDAPDATSIAGLFIKVPVQVGPIFIDDLKIQAKIRLRTDYGIDVVSTIPEDVRKLQLDQQRLRLTFDKANFMTNPPVCTGNSVSGAFGSAQGTNATSTSAVTITGCATMAFAPTLAFSAAPASAAGSSALTTTVTVPAGEQSPPKTISVGLPDGVSLSPSANSAGNLVGCTDAQFAQTTFADTTCPAGSSVGTVSIQTPSVGQLTGNAYLGTAVAGHTARILVDAKSVDFGAQARVKLEGLIDVNATTGKTTVVFDGIPPVPFTSFALTMRGGTNPVLSMPRTCATYNGSSTMTPHSGTVASPAGTLVLSTNCGDAASFAPTLTATTSPTQASANTTLTTTVTIPERHRHLSKMALSLPAGLLANIATATRCSIAAATAGTCAVASRIGSVEALAGQGTTPGTFTGSLYLTDAPTAGDVVGIAVELPAVVGPVDLGKVITIASVKLRPADYGIDVTADVPTDAKGVPLFLRQLKLTIDKAGFLTNPPTCTATNTTSTLTSIGGSTASPSSPFQATGCASLGFNPALSFTAAPQRAAGASAFTTRITAPASAPGTEQGAVKKAVVDLPTGVSLSPSINSAGTLTGCTAAQFAQSTFADPTCPATSAIGTAQIDVPQVGSLTGNVYLATVAPSGAVAGLYVDAKSATFGAAVRVKLDGKVDVDAATGKTTATFDNVPAIAFTTFQLALRGGTNPAISMPRTCGTPTGTAALTPQTGTAVNRTATLTIDVNCADASSFAPTFSNVISPTKAGANTTMVTTVNVPEGHRALSKLAMSLPEGLLAKIDGATRCSIAVATAGNCTVASKIGSVDALAGQGTTPGAFAGSLYLTDAPTAGDVVGIAVELPAVVGPVDLGKVITIASVKLRPADYGIDVSADVPTDVKGIPLFLRQLKLTIDKAGFLTNPVTCAATSTRATLSGQGGGTATPTAAFQATNCDQLGFNPSVSFTGAPSRAAGASAFTARITAPASAPGTEQGALRKAVVDLPTGVSLSSSINSAGTLTGCTNAEFALATFGDPTCPAPSAIGTAKITVPQVGDLTGAVYLAQTIPSGAIAGLFLDAKSTPFGSSVRVKLSGKVDVDAATGKTTATFDNAPAVAFTAFELTMRGGTNPAISMPRTCGTPSGSAALTPQSGAAVTRTSTLTVDVNCGDAASFAATGTVALSDTRAGQDTQLTTTVNVPTGHRELSKVDISLPPGLLAKVAGQARCSVAAAQAGTCAASTEIGTITASAGQGTTPGTFNGKAYLVDAPTSGDIVAIGLSIPVQVGPIDLGTVNVVAPVKLRADYGIDISADVPTQLKGIPMYLTQLRIAITKAGFLFNPSTCGTKTSTLGLTSASYGGATSTANASSSVTIGACDQLAFDPTLAFSASPAKAGGASAFTTTITVPAGAQSALKTASVVLPTGVSLSPSLDSAGTLATCTDAQFDLASTTTGTTCPALSQIGSTTIATASVGQLTGEVFLASSAPVGKLARVLIHARATDFPGVHVKLSGTVDVDPATGVATAVFDDAPEVPFSSFAVTFKGGDQPVISMPRTCGTPTGSASLSPHSGAPAASRSGTLTVDQSCADASSFTPTFTNVIAPTTAGANSTLTSTITIPERHRALSKLALSLPEGLLANIAGATRCSLTAANAGTCSAATKLGTVEAKAGQGNVPGTFNGSLYLTDAPTAGDVVGIAVELPAVVGPVDLGKVITIASVKLRPADYGVDVIADVPTSQKGVALFLRSLKLTIDKAGFLTNPATCAASSTQATLTSVGGSTATPSVPFTATSCDQLGWNPQISFSGSPSRAAGASSFTTKITAPASGTGSEQAALKSAVVDLPTGVSLSSSINAAGNLVGCSAAQFAVDAFSDPTCPAGSVIGSAKVSVPQVGDMVGDVFLASAAPSGAIAGLYLDAKSPTFGAAVRVKLAGKVDVDAATGKTTATFDDAPAIAFTNFELTLRGGTSPAISMPRTCGTPAGSASLTPQTGAAVNRTATLPVDENCGDAASFAATGSVALSDTRAGQDTTLTTSVAVPTGHRELRKVEISLPAGLLANIDGKPRCSVADANAGACAANTEIGTIDAEAGQGTVGATFAGKAYLVDAPSSDDIVGIGLSIPVQVGPVDLGKVNVIADVKLRSDYGIDISAAVPTELKGIPMYLRALDIAITKPGFLFNPSTCGAKTTNLALTSALYGDQRSTASATDTFTITDCDGLAFSPTLAFSATPAKAGGAAGFTTTITLPATAQSALKSASVQLPAGLSLSPSIDSSATLTGCTDGQFDQATPSAAPTCPAAAKIGDTAITTGSVGELTGSVYLAATAPGHLARVFVYAASSAYPGARVKMEGVVDVDEATGLTSADFTGAPEVPFTKFEITFRGGDAPALSMPRTCGTPAGSASLASHAGGAPVSRSATLTIDQDCGNASQFAPTTTVTTAPNQAAAATALTTKITVPSGQQELDRVRLSLPAGLIAKIDGHAKCSTASANAGTCAAASKIGTISAKAGQGDVPGTFSGGSVYLADAPSAGDLVGLAIELPVQVGKVGPDAIVDLGKVTVIGGIKLRQDYGIDIDVPVPTKVKGIPMHLRELTLAIDESGFMINPATCTGNDVTGTLNAAQGGSAPVSTSLSVTNCAAAAFNPAVAFSASPAKPAASAAFTTELTVPAAGNHAPLKKAVVTLPQGVSLSASANAGGDLAGCTDAQFSKATWADPTCAAGSKIGTVTIQTPSVGAITGDAYLADSAPNGSLARVFLDATSTTYGSKVRIKVEGTIAVDEATGATVATFDDLPGVAFTSFGLSLRGGTNPVMSLPRTCGTFAGSAVLTPHAGAAANRTGSLVLDQGCPDANQFAPTVAFDLAPNGAGEAGKLTTTITVPGGDQELSKLRLDLPEGLTAKLKGTLRCTIAQAQADACPAGTQLGTVAAKVGVDGAPFTENGGKVYLTEGRAGNVAGMAIVLPAKVGPIDLGKVITIADVQLRSPDLALQITADVPTSVKGVRLDLRELKLAITKDDFLVNPSSCGVLTGTARFTSKGDRTATDDGTITIPDATCAAQTFDPQITFDAGNPKPGEASDFSTTVTLANGPGAESPFKSVSVRLPEGMSLSPSSGARGDLQGCTDAQFHQDDLAVASTCPAGSEIGTAKFETDLVGDLIGKAYLAPATSGNLARVFLETTATDVPNLTVRVVGEVKVNETTGATDAVFASVPAIPVTKFAVTFRGGDAPALALPRLCGTAQGSGTFVPVNGGGAQTRTAGLVLNTDCPNGNAFDPAVQLDRSTTAAGRSMTFTTTVTVPAKQQELSSLKMVLPAGLLGKISSVPACERADAQNGACAPASQVGTVSAKVGVASAPFTVNGAAYLVKGDADSIARLAIVLPAQVGPIDLGNVVTFADLKLRGDYGLDITAATIPTTVKGVRLDLSQLVLAINKPDFMVNPVSCVPAVGKTTLGSSQGSSVAREQAMNTDACEQLKLNASLAFAAAPASPLTSSVVTTQIRATAGAGEALDAMRSVRVTMPEGLSLSPSAGARGDLAECSLGAFNGGDITVDAACPAGSKVGAVTINSPMVGNLSGDAYLGTKTDGHFAGIYLQAKAAEYPSLRVKIVGTLDVDATTGRLTAAFSELPLVQVSAIDLGLRGGDAPVLSLPRTCGIFAADVNILRHGGASSDAIGGLVLDQDCPDPGAFGPSIELGQSTTQAGADTALTTVVKVPARQQELKSLDLAMPAGLLGRLTVAPKCSLDDARSNRCSDASLVGSAKAKVGVPTAPFGVEGKVFLTDGFDGSIAGLMFALPAKVGPIDLGTVVTLAQLKITGNDLRLGITAADIPTRVKGIPLTISELGIAIDKPGMVLNATTCGDQNAGATFGSAQGGSATGQAGVRTTGCGALNWQPKLSVAFSGPAADTKKLGHPTLTTVIEQTEGQGNLRTANVTLPEGLGADLTNINKRQCASAAAAAAGSCAETAKIGVAEILTSALPEPVDAAIYLVDLPNEPLPGLAIRVRDQIDFDIVGTSKLNKEGRIVANFDGLPDTPISKMTLVFNGGSGGIMQLSSEACTTGVKTDGILTAQHGAQKTFAIPVTCNGATTPLSTQPAVVSRALATASFKPSGSASSLTFALSNPAGISKIVLRMPKGAIFTKKAAKLVKLSLTGAKAKTFVVNGERRMAISIKPIKAGEKVTKVKFKLPKKAIKINIKVRKVLLNKKTSKKKKAKILAKLLKPAVTMIDGNGTSTAVKITTKVATK